MDILDSFDVFMGYQRAFPFKILQTLDMVFYLKLYIAKCILLILLSF